MIGNLQFSHLTPFYWSTFWRFLLWSVEFLVARPFAWVTLGLALNLVAALIRQWPFRAGVWKKQYWIVFASFLCIPATIAIAVVGQVDASPMVRRTPNELAVWAANGLFVISLTLGALSIYRMKGVRWFAVAVVLVQLWLLSGAEFIAGMSLSGDWL